jgi:Activator of Hsp90 ATPase homolog 1-like protein
VPWHNALAMPERTRGYAHRIDVAIEPEYVWRALTTTASLRLWCSPAAEINARPGGVFRANVDRITKLEAHIDVFVPERRLRLIYLPCPTLPSADSALIDDFIIEGADSMTILRLLAGGIPGGPAWDAPFMRLRVSWEHAMTRLRDLLDGQRSKGASP